MLSDEPRTSEKPLSWYEVVDIVTNLWLLLVGAVWIWKLSPPSNYAALILCDWVMHMEDLNV